MFTRHQKIAHLVLGSEDVLFDALENNNDLTKRFLLLEKWDADGSISAAWTFDTLEEAAKFAAESETVCTDRRFYDLDQEVQDLDDIESIPYRTEYHFRLRPVAIVTVSGGVAEVAESAGLAVAIIDFDNLKETLASGEGVVLDEHEIDYLRRRDPDFLAELEPLLKLGDETAKASAARADAPTAADQSHFTITRSDGREASVYVPSKEQEAANNS